MTEQEIDALAFEHTRTNKRADLAFKAGYQAAMQENEKLNEQVKLLHNALVMVKSLCCCTDCHEIANNAIAKYEEMREKN